MKQPALNAAVILAGVGFIALIVKHVGDSTLGELGKGLARADGWYPGARPPAQKGPR